MEKEVKWTSRSELNLFSIFQYIAQDSEIYAERFVTRLIKHSEEQLKTYTEIGRYVPEFQSTPLAHLRELIFKGYRIIYDPSDTAIYIIAIIHGRMDINEQF
jgi:plasmid stabilization system protein ParE